MRKLEVGGLGDFAYGRIDTELKRDGILLYERG